MIDDKIMIPEESIHIWLADIEKEGPNHECLSCILSPGEKERIKRFVFDKDKKRFLITHGLLRLILGRYTGIAPDALRFSVMEKGKPVLENSGGRDIRFNLSHSGKYVIYAITERREIGIDIEYMREFSDADRIVNRFFSKREIEEYFRLDPGMRKRAFFKCWTRKEAFIKAIGRGFYMPLRNFSVSPDPDAKSGIEIHQESIPDRKWSIYDVELEDADYTASIAYEGQRAEIAYLKW